MSATSEVFWGEMGPCEHLVQIYDNAEVFIDTLEGFVAGGLRAGDGVVVIAMPAHLYALSERLSASGFDLDLARLRDQYVDLEAEETLAKFMREDGPDEEIFTQFVTDLLLRAGQGGRRVRAFGEMVAVLWANGDGAATMHLERLWHDLCQKEAFTLFCAYPRNGFGQGAEESIREICETHSKVVTCPPGRIPAVPN
jgi:hypothetical protein